MIQVLLGLLSSTKFSSVVVVVGRNFRLSFILLLERLGTFLYDLNKDFKIDSFRVLIAYEKKEGEEEHSTCNRAHDYS